MSLRHCKRLYCHIDLPHKFIHSSYIHTSAIQHRANDVDKTPKENLIAKSRIEKQYGDVKTGDRDLSFTDLVERASGIWLGMSSYNIIKHSHIIH